MSRSFWPNPSQNFSTPTPHDTVEDTALSVSDVEARFGKEVATIVDGVTQLGKVQFSSATELQVENDRKILLSIEEDARVILVKLADRLHNMRTLEHLPMSKQRRSGRSTRLLPTAWGCSGYVDPVERRPNQTWIGSVLHT